MTTLLLLLLLLDAASTAVITSLHASQPTAIDGNAQTLSLQLLFIYFI